MEKTEKVERNTMLLAAFAAIEIALMVYAIFQLSNVVGTSDTSNELTKTIIPIVAILGVIVCVHTILWYLYFQYDPMAMNTYFLISGNITMIFSLTALGISLTQRK